MMKKFFMAGLVSLGLLASCSTDDDATTGGGSTGNAYLQVQLEVIDGAGASGTRAEESTPTTNATDPEVAVNSLTVALVDPSTDVIRQVYTLNDLKKDNTNKTLVATKPFSVSQGTYHVYVFANASDYSEIAVNANVKTAILSVSSYTGANCPMASATNGFLMSNADYVTTATTIKASEGSDPATDTEVGYDGSEMSTGGQKNINVVKDVEIERAVAKVVAKQATTISKLYKEGSDTEIGSASIQGVELINLNSKTYPVKNMLANGIDAPMAYTDLYYVKDPNYNSNDQNKQDFYNSTVSGDFTTIDPTNGATFYCLENTMEGAAQLNGYTTGLLYKVQVTLNNNQYSTLSTSESATDAYSVKFRAVVNDHPDLVSVFTEVPTTTGSFYEYGGFYFKNEKAAKMYKAIDNNLSADASTIYTAYSGYTGAQADIHEYVSGIAYYPAWIRHNTANETYLAQGKYGVVRNHWYEVDVKKITGVGYYSPTYGSDPDNPDDEAKAYLQVAVKIKAWRYIQQRVEL